MRIVNFHLESPGIPDYPISLYFCIVCCQQCFRLQKYYFSFDCANVFSFAAQKLRPMREKWPPDGATDDKDEPDNIRRNGRKQPVHYTQGRNATHKHGGTQAEDTVKTR